MADEIPFREKIRTLAFLSGGRTQNQVREWRTDDGERHKATTDELNNTVVQHARGDRQDVRVRPSTVRVTVSRGALHGVAQGSIRAQ